MKTGQRIDQDTREALKHANGKQVRKLIRSLSRWGNQYKGRGFFIDKWGNLSGLVSYPSGGGIWIAIDRNGVSHS